MRYRDMMGLASIPGPLFLCRGPGPSEAISCAATLTAPTPSRVHVPGQSRRVIMAGIEAAAEEAVASCKAVSDERLKSKLQQWKNSEGRPLVVVAIGRGGVGKSTLINNLLQLEKNDKQHCAEGKFASAETRKVEVRIKKKEDVEVHIVDTPGLGAILDKIEPKCVIEELAKKTNKEVDFLFYCISLHVRPDNTDLKIVQLLTTVYGPAVWERAFLVLTFANQCEKDDYETKIQSYADKFSTILGKAKIKIPVKVILPTEEDTPRDCMHRDITQQDPNDSTSSLNDDAAVPEARAVPHMQAQAQTTDASSSNCIPAIPVGGKKEILDHPCKHNWSEKLFLEVLKKATDPHCLSSLLVLRGFASTKEEVLKVIGVAAGGGAVGGIIGSVIGAGAGLGAGVVIGAPVGIAAVGISSAIVEIIRAIRQESRVKF